MTDPSLGAGTDPERPDDVGRHVLRERGHHKVFLGYAAGVGKTFTMLAEAQRRASRGQDVVVGFVEPHRRPETISLMTGLERIEPKRLEYRGAVFEEMDTAAVIARRPEWALVDELAHTNVPGSVHEKRWQSVEEILDAGIGVISTVNVQHIESLNDTVFEITGVRVRETLPDRVIEQAEEVVLVDITPQALINRLKRGVIYDPAKVPQALQNFFRRGNLTALRELALRITAEEVDEELLDYMEEKHIEESWAAQTRVLVAVTTRPMATKLVRRGYRLAHRLQGMFWTLCVSTPGSRCGSGSRRVLDEAFDLTRRLGGEAVELTADSPAEGIIAFAREHQVTIIVMGQSARSRLDEVIRGSIVTRIMRATTNIDVVVVADPERG